MTNEERIEANNAALEECIALAEDLPDGGSAELTVTLAADEFWYAAEINEDNMGGLEIEQIGAIANVFNVCVSAYEDFVVTKNYDALYASLQAGKTVKLDVSGAMLRISEEIFGVYYPSIQTVIGYMITSAGLLVYTAIMRIIFPNGSAHNDTIVP